MLKETEEAIVVGETGEMVVTWVTGETASSDSGRGGWGVAVVTGQDRRGNSDWVTGEVVVTETE